MTEKFVGVVNHHELQELLQAHAMDFGIRCRADGVRLFVSRLQKCLGTPRDDRYSYVWRHAIEKHEAETHSDSYRSALLDGVRDSLLGFIQVAREEAADSVKELLNSEYRTLMRVGIFACGESYQDFREVFWNNFNRAWFVDLSFWHEIYWLIKKSASKFTISDSQRFLNEVVATVFDPEDSDEAKTHSERHRRDLLFPAVGAGHKEIDELYFALEREHGAPGENPDVLIGPVRAMRVGERSPITTDQILANPRDWLVEQMQQFDPTKSWEAPTLRGFGDTLAAAVRASKDGLSSRLEDFVNVRRAFQHGFLRGTLERWSADSVDIEWASVLDFIDKVLSSPSLKTEADAPATAGWEPNVDWLVSDIGDLLKSGAQDSKRTMPSAALPHALEISKAILALYPTVPATEPQDAVSHAINSPRGRAMEALINIALAMRRSEVAADAKESTVWVCIEPTLSGELKSSEVGQNAEFAAFCGLYCTNLHYLNPQWVESNFERMFPRNVPAAWSCAVQGLSYQQYLYEWLYVLLRNGGHLRDMIAADELPNTVSERAIQFLGLAYLEGYESLKTDAPGLLDEMLQNGSPEQIKTLSWFFWTCRGIPEQQAENRDRILAFWIAAHGARLSARWNSPEASSSLVLLSAFISRLDGHIKDALLHDAPHAQAGHHGYILMEQLRRLVSAYPKDVYDVLIVALDGFVPDYNIDDVIAIVRGIAEGGLVDQAEDICRKFVDKGSSALNSTYSELRATSPKSVL